MKKFFLITSALTFLYFFGALSSNCVAAEFSTAYDVTYMVRESGITTVTNKITLTNLKSDLYAKEYTVTIGSEKIENPLGFDSLGELTLKVSKDKGETEIGALFNEKVVGRGENLTFTLSYDTPEVALRQGKIWEVNIPKPFIDKTISSYKITLSVPSSFGQPAYFKPKPNHGSSWIFDQSFSSSIHVAYGEFQSFDFDLLYHFKNNTLIPRIFSIPLPSDTLYQKVIIDSLSPTPNNVNIDEDGNWLASYQLLPQQTITAQVKGTAFLFLEKRSDYPLPDLQNKNKYLSQQKFWEVNDEQIVKLSRELKTPSKIYQYIVKNLSYDKTRVGKEGERLGAKKILRDPKKATCMEFTDLFIALCRAAGIPAREINGIGFTNNPILKPLLPAEDVLHAWPEYFDFEKKIWVPVDPTWGRTAGGNDYFNTLDFNHLALVIHGVSSTQPVPPGAYDLDDKRVESNKNIKVSFSQKNTIEKTFDPELSLDFPKEVIAGSQIMGDLKVKNPNSQALYNLSLEVFSSKIAPKYENFKISILPPFGYQSFNLKFPCQNFLLREKNDFIFRLGAIEKKNSVIVQPAITTLLPYFLGFACLLVTVSLGLIRLRRIWK